MLMKEAPIIYWAVSSDTSVALLLTSVANPELATIFRIGRTHKPYGFLLTILDLPW